MHETTAHSLTVVLLRVTAESSGNPKLHPQAYGAVSQYFLAVLVSCVLVRPPVRTPEHPQ
jgi:hypothetical protein